MEMWWWIVPLLKTGGVIFLVGFMIASLYGLFKSEFSSWMPVVWILVISLIPLIVAALSFVLFILCDVFYDIWIPYI